MTHKATVGTHAVQPRRRWQPALAPICAALTVIGIATAASALTIHGGPLYAGSGGVTGSCTASGNACLTAGATVTCTGLNASSNAVHLSDPLL
jgi:hypothetical protein